MGQFIKKYRSEEGNKGYPTGPPRIRDVPGVVSRAEPEDPVYRGKVQREHPSPQREHPSPQRAQK